MSKAIRKVGVLSLWGDPEIVVKLPRPSYAPKLRKAKKISTPATHLAALIVRTYARFRKRSGQEVGDKNWRGELASTARKIAETERWSEDVMLRATAEFAETETKRRPAFFLEWIREAYWRLFDDEAAYWKGQEKMPLAPDVAAAIGKPFLHRMPARYVPRDPEREQSDRPPKKMLCMTCLDTIWIGGGCLPHLCPGKPIY